MVKKKSKTQKYKKNQKKKIQKVQTSKKNNQNKIPKETKKQNSNQLVSKENVKYNVVLNKIVQNNTKKQQNNQTNTENKKTSNNIISKIKNKITILCKKQEKKQSPKSYNSKRKKVSHKIEKEIKKSLPSLKTEQDLKKKNIFIRLFYEIKNNTHIIFNTILIITFITLLIGLIRINVFKTGTIVYISCIIIFLMIVAISYNKYISGKIFTIIITAGMFVGIYYMQYTYDYIRNLNSNIYEYKTYYVVAFDTTINRSIYTINNKKVGLLKENCINIERKLNTKLDKVNYIEYENINDLFEDFYNSKFKAILVNENQYNYLKNKIEPNSRDIKILYEFKVNAKK
ncbi:MAG: hypothetical protein ACI4XM_04400 [Candidatus Coprovivens sp.]